MNEKCRKRQTQISKTDPQHSWDQNNNYHFLFFFTVLDQSAINFSQIYEQIKRYTRKYTHNITSEASKNVISFCLIQKFGFIWSTNCLRLKMHTLRKLFSCKIHQVHQRRLTDWAVLNPEIKYLTKTTY